MQKVKKVSTRETYEYEGVSEMKDHLVTMRSLGWERIGVNYNIFGSKNIHSATYEKQH